MYDIGEGVVQDYKTAVNGTHLLLNKDMSLPSTPVMYEGDGVTQDYKTAVKWYTLAAEQGHASAQFNLGVIHDNGMGVIQDYKTAQMVHLLLNK